MIKSQVYVSRIVPFETFSEDLLMCKTFRISLENREVSRKLAAVMEISENWPKWGKYHGIVKEEILCGKTVYC